jgi:hypothetical protein
MNDTEQPLTIETVDVSEAINPKDLIGAKKIPLSIIPAPALMELAMALLEGATKYGPFNYRAIPVQSHVYIEAAIGHLLSYQDGEDIDTDSGLHHVTKCMACCAIIIDCLHTGTIKDTRPTRSLPGAGSFSRDPSKVLGDQMKIKALLSKPWVKV